MDASRVLVFTDGVFAIEAPEDSTSNSRTSP